VEAKTRSTTSNVYNLRGEPVLDGAEDEVEARAVALARTGVVLAAEDAPSYTDQTVEDALKAGARQRKIFMARVVVSPGVPEVNQRGAVFVEGLGARADGPWVVESVTHDLTGDRTTADIYSDGAE
jgi:phage protein D